MYNPKVMLKNVALCLFTLLILRSGASAGFLSGNAAVQVNGAGLYALKFNTAILMAGTPFSSACLAGKYGYDERLSVYAKYGIGTVDYTTVDIKLSTEPQISTLGLDYLLSGSRKDQFTALVIEYETASWSIEKKSNISSEIMFGYDYSYISAPSTRTRYRLGLHNFHSGFESEENLATSVKYSLSTEVEYDFTNNLRGSFEAGMFFGDLKGLISYFGFGLGFNS